MSFSEQSPSPEESAIKGTAIREYLLWYGNEYGQDALEGVWARLPADMRSQLDGSHPALGILPATWYPIPLAHAILDSISEGRSQQELDLAARHAAQCVVQRVHRGVYRFVFRNIATPERYAKHIQRLWNMLHTTGSRRIVLTSVTTAESYVENWPDHHPTLCLATVHTMAEIFRAMGLRDVSVEVRECVSKGDRRCHTHLEWAP